MVGKAVGLPVTLDGLVLSVSIGNSTIKGVGSTVDPMVGNAVGVSVRLNAVVTVVITVGRSVEEVVGSRFDTVIVGKTVCIPVFLDGMDVSDSVGIIGEMLVRDVVVSIVDNSMVGNKVGMLDGLELSVPIGRAVERPTGAVVCPTTDSVFVGIPIVRDGLKLLLMIGSFVGI
jgi:hypothetical protein